LRERARHAAHLVSRFIGHLNATGLTPHQQQQVHDRLDEPAAELFWAQSTADQRHAFDVATRVAAVLPGDDEAFVAALLHDVGKRHAGLGAVRRSIATVLGGVGLPMTASMQIYRGHGPVGAAELRAVGFDGLVVDFAAGHPSRAPDGADGDRWNALLKADG
jgi:putative nucleotidyltransferase with HDIG domain